MGVAIGNYVVTSESETFRIFPRNRAGDTIPITRVNQFLNLRCVKSGMLVVFKRYLHQGQWYWRDSRDKGPCCETVVLAEVARMLFNGDQDRAGGLLVQVVTGQELAA